MNYIIERLGDLHGSDRYKTFQEAIGQLEKEYPIKRAEKDEWSNLKEGELYRTTPDPEDDRILIWEELPSGHRKVVWHFSGWHWDAEEFGIPQGKLGNDTKSLYKIAMEQY